MGAFGVDQCFEQAGFDDPFFLRVERGGGGEEHDSRKGERDGEGNDFHSDAPAFELSYSRPWCDAAIGSVI